MHALNSEHAQSVRVGRAYFKPRGVKKNSVPYMIEIVLTNVPV